MSNTYFSKFYKRVQKILNSETCCQQAHSNSSAKISESLRPDIKNHYYYLNVIPTALELRKSKNTNEPELHLKTSKIRSNTLNFLENLCPQIENLNLDKKYIKNITVNKAEKNPDIIFHLNSENFYKDSLTNTEEFLKMQINKPQKVVVEFSSPNIAKPFHVGHLRSTIIGNFIANLNKTLGKNVIKLNYLGDWGTQFGLLQIGVELSGLTNEEIQKNPIENLFKAYVNANRLANNDPKIADKARDIFKKLEAGELDLKRWEKFRKYTITELKSIYERLGVQFDDYDWESQYKQKDICDIVEKLQKKGILINEVDGRQIAIIGDRRIPVIKSDGSTLYLARDVAALLDRFERYKFDSIYYVVDNSQTDHFKACFGIAEQIEQNVSKKLNHIKFGRIKGMSTRQGNVVFLKDVLNEARDIMIQKQKNSPTTKIDLDNMDVNTADVLGISAVIINDLKQRRQRDYLFSWDNALQATGDTGVKLQYTHCRLSNLISENSTIEKANTPKLEYLRESVAQNLILEIAKFPEVIIKSHQELESCILVNYLFSLCNTTSRALKYLNIKNEKCFESQSQRLLLFETSRQILNKGMKILGLKPLTKM
ncbi:probable arginine--tRNA ligase, mitochondrial isoform X2 [Condylostylus longicornis]|uniref:probable arginine--tRNA ligase, mitochondrial isoform X2 n=1 Tax=Condylostylus longicornis TaxID=2530218 RepID=UPI00244DFC94|nr:probable arginine--tRNA ligase, mitochondrial isoform X2 [Condylostylus longicornis]